MSTLRILLASLTVALCGILLFAVACFTQVEGLSSGSATPAEEAQAGHNQKWVRLPFGTCAPEDLPAARTPDGKPLTLARVAGHYYWTERYGARGILIDDNGGCRISWASCVDSGTSQGVARIVNGRIEIEALSKAGRRTGLKCLCVPVWWEGVVYLLGPSSGGPGSTPVDFCNSVNWGELNDSRDSFFSFEGLYSSHAPPDSRAECGVPEEIARGILRMPIEGEVLEETPGGSRVGLGKRNGVYLGQRLRAGHFRGGCTVRVLEATEDTCLVGSSLDDSTPPPAKGTTVWSSAMGASSQRVR